jgi:internalin A
MNRRELLTIIEEAKRGRLKSLSLCGMGIRTLPPEIGQLISLTSLDLSYNDIKILPESLWQLINLRSLQLNTNRIRKISPLIEELKNLYSLDISHNKIEDLPSSIGDLLNLRVFRLSGNRIESLPESFKRLTSVTSISISENERNKDFAEWINHLENLQDLSLSLHHAKDLNEEILRKCPLKSLTISGEGGKYVECFSFFDSGINPFPDWVFNLAHLTSLNIYECKFEMAFKNVANLSNLENLSICNSDIKALPESIGELFNLRTLNLQSNSIRALPETISKLNCLSSIVLSSNKFSEFPQVLRNLPSLEKIDLSYNEIEILPVWIGELTNLKALKLTRNQLKELPFEIIQLEKLRKLYLVSNSLNIPPEITRKYAKPYLVFEFLRQLKEEGVDYIYEAKLLVIGEGGAGKTSLANKLINPNYELKLEGSKTPEKSTEGIELLRLDFDHPSGNPFRINIWDFGGQEIYHATHQFFLTKRSLYLLVADTRQDNTDFNYWLEVVELLSETSPVLIVKNEKQERPCQVNESQLRGRFSNLRDTSLATNLATNRGLPEIRAAIQHHISQLPHIGQALPKTWVNVRKALESETRNFIPQTEFLALCDTHGFKRHEDKLQLSEYLHDLGVCLHFQEDPILKNWVILKPEWGTAAVYTVLDTEKVQKSFGTFTQADLAIIWADEQYTDMRDELLQLMMRFKLCYEIPHHPKNYIAPQLLSPNQQTPDDWDKTDNLILRYHYEFMPKGMITRFIVEMHRFIDNGLVWKDGVILRDEHARAEVIEARYRNEIRIRISGQLKKPLLENIRYEFRKIHESYNKPDEPPETHRLHYKEFIPCNCAVCNGSQMPHAYALQDLQKRLKDDRHEIECNISYQMVNVRGLIDDTIGSSQPVKTNENSPNIYHSGDIVYGDKVGKDKVAGDKTEHP